MRATMCLIGAMLMTAAMPVQAARLAPEVRIAKELAGRVAGKPVDCIPLHQIRSTQIFERTAILYKVGSTWYLNRPASGANFLDQDDILVTDTHSSNLCSIDIVRLVDQGSRMPGGSLGLGQFVPYTKPKG